MKKVLIKTLVSAVAGLAMLMASSCSDSLKQNDEASDVNEARFVIDGPDGKTLLNTEDTGLGFDEVQEENGFSVLWWAGLTKNEDDSLSMALPAYPSTDSTLFRYDLTQHAGKYEKGCNILITGTLNTAVYKNVDAWFCAMVDNNTDHLASMNNVKANGKSSSVEFKILVPAYKTVEDGKYVYFKNIASQAEFGGCIISDVKATVIPCEE